MISQEARDELARMLAHKPPERPLAQRRRDWELEARAQVLPRGSRFTPAMAGEVPAEWMQMPHAWPDRVLLFLHGGGYHNGSPRTHRRLVADLARVTHMRVLTPEYRLAPEHPYPAAVMDALVAYRWLIGQGIAADRIVVGGDSAGGGLALSLLLALREAGAALPLGAVLLAPWTDLTCSGGSYTRLRKFDPVITRDALRQAGREYAGERDPADPMLSPLFADLSGLPPLLVHVGGDEVMLDDSRVFAQRAREAGVTVSLRIFEGMWHVFHAAGTGIPEARQAVDEIGSFVKALFADAESERAGG